MSAARAAASTPEQIAAALERPDSDPPTRLDGLCVVCLGRRPPVALEHDDPFCTSRCARAYHGHSLARP